MQRFPHQIIDLLNSGNTGNTGNTDTNNLMIILKGMRSRDPKDGPMNLLEVLMMVPHESLVVVDSDRFMTTIGSREGVEHLDQDGIAALIMNSLTAVILNDLFMMGTTILQIPEATLTVDLPHLRIHSRERTVQLDPKTGKPSGETINIGHRVYELFGVRAGWLVDEDDTDKYGMITRCRIFEAPLGNSKEQPFEYRYDDRAHKAIEAAIAGIEDDLPLNVYLNPQGALELVMTGLIPEERLTEEEPATDMTGTYIDLGDIDVNGRKVSFYVYDVQQPGAPLYFKTDRD